MSTNRWLASLLIVASLLAILTSPGAAQTTRKSDKPSSGKKKPHPALLKPELAKEKAPAKFRAKFETSQGSFVIEVVRKWAPRGADRFFNLVKIGFYDETRFFRVIPGFMAQIGYHADPAVTRAWSTTAIPDDPVVASNTRGMVTFALSGPNTRTTQFFINFGSNKHLDTYRGGKFAPFGKVVEGMSVVDKLYGGYGDAPPGGRGPSQGQIQQEGNRYLSTRFPKLDYVKKAFIVGETKAHR